MHLFCNCKCFKLSVLVCSAGEHGGEGRGYGFHSCSSNWKKKKKALSWGLSCCLMSTRVSLVLFVYSLLNGKMYYFDLWRGIIAWSVGGICQDQMRTPGMGIQCITLKSWKIFAITCSWNWFCNHTWCSNLLVFVAKYVNMFAVLSTSGKANISVWWPNFRDPGAYGSDKARYHCT